jgi:hypothetical protein
MRVARVLLSIMSCSPDNPSLSCMWGRTQVVNGACLCNEAMLTILVPEFAFSNPAQGIETLSSLTDGKHAN